MTRVIASRDGISGVQRVREMGVELDVPDQSDYENSLKHLVESSEPDLICLCGYLKKLTLHSDWYGKVINIHPSLLPLHGGKGMYGIHVHRAAINSGKHFSGCTVHFVDEHYDHGPILLQRACPIEPGDTAEKLAERVFEQECIALPEAVKLISSGKATLVDGRVKITAACEFGRSSL